MGFRERILASFLALASALALSGCRTLDSHPGAVTETSSAVKSEFIYETAPFPSCHASTLAESNEGLVAAWFGGTDERNPDVGIWTARHNGQKWSAPVEVANGIQEPGGSKRFPTWNPVLYQPKKALSCFFYKVGPKPDRWWGMVTTSSDAGKTWSKPKRLPEGILGPDQK
jgi:predicted neuraminidase